MRSFYAVQIGEDKPPRVHTFVTLSARNEWLSEGEDRRKMTNSERKGYRRKVK
jgi:hypothetical protein